MKHHKSLLSNKLSAHYYAFLPLFLLITCHASGQSGWQINSSNPLADFGISKGGIPFLKIDSRGQVRISAPGAHQTFRLSVDGMVRAREIYVNQDNWPDYVFDKSYRLPALSEIEKYIQRYRHLPGIPDRENIRNKGLSIGNMQTAMMQKIEELTLYVIAQQKEIDELKLSFKRTQK